MNAELEGIYVAAALIESDTQEEKCEIIANLVRIKLTLQALFAGNRNLDAALEYVDSSFLSYLSEVDFEHTIMTEIQNYIQKYEFHLSEEQIAELDTIMETFENLCDSRILNMAMLIEFFDDLIDNGVLTNRNYYVSSLPVRISEEKREKMLAFLQ